MARRDRRATPAYPYAIEREYVGSLRDYVRRLYAAATPTIIRASGLRRDNESDLPNPWGAMEGRIELVFGGVAFDPRETEKVGEQLDVFSQRQHARLMNVVPAIDPFRSEPWLEPVMSAWSKANASLITTIPQRALGDVERAVTEAWRRGLSTRGLSALLEERFGVTARRAELIARDQVGKLNGQLNGVRQAAAGIERYRWRTARDPRVRQEHAEREGDVFSWAEPPPGGHPGQPINCRCSPEPVIDDLAEDVGTEEHAERVRGTVADAIGGLLEGVDVDPAPILRTIPSVADIIAAVGTAATAAPAPRRSARGERRVRTGRRSRQPRAPRTTIANLSPPPVGMKWVQPPAAGAALALVPLSDTETGADVWVAGEARPSIR